MDMDWIGQELIDFCKLPVEVSDDCGPARLRGLPLDLLGLAVVQSNKELDKDKEDKEEEKELVKEEERRLGTLGWAGTAILAQPPSRPPSPPHPTTPPDFYLFLPPGFFRNLFFVPRFLQHVLFFKLLQLPAALLFLVPDFLSGFLVNIFFNRFLDPIQYAFTFLPASHVYFLTFLDF